MNKTAALSAGLLTVIGLIIAVVTAAALGMTVLQAKEQTEKIAEGTACKTTLKAQEFTQKKSLLPNIDNNCATMRQSIKVQEGEEALVLKLFADKMARTWNIVHEGSIPDMWNRDGLFKGKGCLILYSIDVKNKFLSSEINPIPREQLVDYLEYTTYPLKEEEGWTYNEYLTINGAGRGSYMVFPQTKGDNIGPDVQFITSNDVYAIGVISTDFGKANVLGLSTAGTIFLGPIGGAVARIKMGKAQKEIPGESILFISTMDYAEKTIGCEYK